MPICVKLPRVRVIDGPLELVAADMTLSVDVRPMKRARALAAAVEQRSG